jgi:hypothetical protein
MRRLAILGTLLGSLMFVAAKPADAQYIYGRPAPVRRALRATLPPYGYYYGPRSYYGQGFYYGPRYYGAYYGPYVGPWGGYYYW